MEISDYINIIHFWMEKCHKQCFKKDYKLRKNIYTFYYRQRVNMFHMVNMFQK